MAMRVRAPLLLRKSGWLQTANKATAASVAVEDAGLPPMPACDFKPQPYEGPTYERVREIRKDNLSPALLTFYRQPVLIHQGHMQWLFDHEGKRYLDLFGGIVTVSVGHCHPKVTNALEKQMKKLWHTTSIYMQPKIHEFAEKLVAKLPGNLKNVYFVNSGSEANDLAVLMARLHTGRFDVISFRNAYHGASPYLMGLTSLSTWRYNVAQGFGMHQTMNPDVYRGPWGGKACRDSPIQTDRACSCSPGACQACDKYVDQLDDVLKHCTPKGGIAGFFAEAIQGVGGSVQFPKDYLKRAFDMVRSKGGICISDEVQTGFGRTGTHYWGFEGHGVMPDMVTMAKGIGNGFPLAAVVTTPEIAQSMASAVHFNTFGGNPLSCAVGSAVMDALEEDKCQQNSHEVGTYFMEKLADLKQTSRLIGDVRGKGLMIGCEMVSDLESRAPLDANIMGDIWEACKDYGVLLGKGGLYGNVFRIKPPMCVTKEDVDFTIAVMKKCISDAESKM